MTHVADFSWLVSYLALLVLELTWRSGPPQSLYHSTFGKTCFCFLLSVWHRFGLCFEQVLRWPVFIPRMLISWVFQVMVTEFVQLAVRCCRCRRQGPYQYFSKTCSSNYGLVRAGWRARRPAQPWVLVVSRWLRVRRNWRQSLACFARFDKVTLLEQVMVLASLWRLKSWYLLLEDVIVEERRFLGAAGRSASAQLVRSLPPTHLCLHLDGCRV